MIRLLALQSVKHSGNLNRDNKIENFFCLVLLKKDLLNIYFISYLIEQ